MKNRIIDYFILFVGGCLIFTVLSQQSGNNNQKEKQNEYLRQASSHHTSR